MDFEFIQELSELDCLYGEVDDGARRKVSPVLTPLYSEWIAASKFCVMSTVGSESTDVSPRGDKKPVVRIIDEKSPTACSFQFAGLFIREFMLAKVLEFNRFGELFYFFRSYNLPFGNKVFMVFCYLL